MFQVTGCLSAALKCSLFAVWFCLGEGQGEGQAGIIRREGKQIRESPALSWFTSAGCAPSVYYSEWFCSARSTSFSFWALQPALCLVLQIQRWENPPAAISCTPLNTVIVLNSPLFSRLGMLFPADKEDTERIACNTENCWWSVPMWQVSWVTRKWKNPELYLHKLKQELGKFRSLTYDFFYMTPNNTIYFLPHHCTKMIWIFTVLGKELGVATILNNRKWKK